MTQLMLTSRLHCYCCEISTSRNSISCRHHNSRNNVANFVEIFHANVVH